MSKFILVTVGFCLILLGCSNKAGPVQGPAKSLDDVKAGTPKNEIVQRLGKPLNWATVNRRNSQMSVTTLFDINAAKRQMPADEIWLFEYSLADGRKYVIHFSADKVDQVVEGALLKE
jgi:hypothetical protein